MGLFSRGYRSVSAPDAKELVEAGHTLVDVRSDKEWEEGHVEGAVHLPLPELGSRLGELPAGTPIVAVCHTGIRSALAARKLAKHGYPVMNLRGGMIAWNRVR